MTRRSTELQMVSISILFQVLPFLILNIIQLSRVHTISLYLVRDRYSESCSKTEGILSNRLRVILFNVIFLSLSLGYSINRLCEWPYVKLQRRKAKFEVYQEKRGKSQLKKLLDKRLSTNEMEHRRTRTLATTATTNGGEDSDDGDEEKQSSIEMLSLYATIPAPIPSQAAKPSSAYTQKKQTAAVETATTHPPRLDVTSTQLSLSKIPLTDTPAHFRQTETPVHGMAKAEKATSVSTAVPHPHALAWRSHRTLTEITAEWQKEQEETLAAQEKESQLQPISPSSPTSPAAIAPAAIAANLSSQTELQRSASAGASASSNTSLLQPNTASQLTSVPASPSQQAQTTSLLRIDTDPTTHLSQTGVDSSASTSSSSSSASATPAQPSFHLDTQENDATTRPPQHPTTSTSPNSTHPQSPVVRIRIHH